MAQKRMHRILDLATGHISISDWVYDGSVSLNEVIISYDDELKPEHAQMIADAIDKRVSKLNADIFVMKQKKQDFLALVHKQPEPAKSAEPVWEEVEDVKPENDVPF